MNNNANIINESESREEKEIDIEASIYRYKFTQEFMGALYEFSKIHQYDGRKNFKEAWIIWMENTAEMIDNEISRLSDIGYKGDIKDKMFKSARYYFRKKSSCIIEPCKRRNYISVEKELLDVMDRHIYENISKNDYKPSVGFVNFCKENTSILKQEICKLVKQNFTDVNMIQEKMKKTYKNRYFMIINNK